MKSLIALVLAFFSVLICSAQDSTVILIPAGTPILEKLTPAKRFRFPDFRPGKVVFKDGSIAPARLNYSFLSGEVEFIGPANDTLAISDDKVPLIKDILIDSTVFYFNNDYFEVIASHAETGWLVKKELLVEMTREKVGAYGMSSSTSSVQSFSSIGNRSNRVHSIVEGLAPKENLYLKLAVDYFIENKDNEILPANKRNFLKIFSIKRKAINDYLDKNQVNFNNEDDLKRLFIAINK